jgi:hypothetical protein
MTRWIADWVWRLALLGALCWVGWELHRFHDDMMQPVEEPAVVAAEPDAVQDGLEAIRDDLDVLTRKVDAILFAMTRTR